MHTVVNIYCIHVYLYENKEEATIIPRERLKNLFFFVFSKMLSLHFVFRSLFSPSSKFGCHCPYLMS